LFLLQNLTSHQCQQMQVVHHLFPGISHTHYPAIAPIVLQTCKEFGVPYKVYPTVRRLSRHSCCKRLACDCSPTHVAIKWQVVCA